MTTEFLSEKFRRLEEDAAAQNQINQANARYILFNTGEERENFPIYTIEDQRLDLLALQYLSVGCGFAENQDLVAARRPLERGAAILEYVHGARTNRRSISGYYISIACLAYYSSFQYSKAFILIKNNGLDSNIGQMIFYFISRRYQELNNFTAEILISDRFREEAILQLDDPDQEVGLINEKELARAFSMLIKFIQFGNREMLESAKALLRNLMELATLNEDPALWWLIRLIIIVSDGVEKAALWISIANHFDLENDFVSGYIKALLFQKQNPVYELFISQRAAIEKTLAPDQSACVVSIPTSSGKTRIAEISMLRTLTESEGSKILYLAPYRSLAFEIENSLAKIFEPLGFGVSHLYGGAMYSQMDEQIVAESSIIIATPEKAKAIFRANPDIFSSVRLVIVDEGHLLGPSQRLITNEIFLEELKYFVKQQNGVFLLLSAVLPNADELAHWLGGDSAGCYQDKWRPSDERIGILEWNRVRVNLQWESEDNTRQSFHNRFVVRAELPWVARQRVAKYFPAEKTDAIAATAVKLRVFGSMLIYVSQKRSVFKMARAYERALSFARPAEQEPEEFRYRNIVDWTAYRLACIENYGENCDWLRFAREGILCHHGALHADVRMPLERLMRGEKPNVIISTSTLGQGVNLGVSSVIFSNLRQGEGEMTKKDFWNIAGRAGRAFVDSEGKILVAHETTGNERTDEWTRRNIKAYFDKSQMDPAQSGIYILIKRFKQIADENSVDFDLFIQLIAENRVSEIGNDAVIVDAALDWIDDTLLALHSIHNPEAGISTYDWVEDFFAQSLTVQQNKNETTITNQQLIRFVGSRTRGIVAKVGEDRNVWQALIRSGLPLRSDLLIEAKYDDLVEATEGYIISEQTIGDLIELQKNIEIILQDIELLKTEEGEALESEDWESIRAGWLQAQPIQEMEDYENVGSIINSVYGFTYPWILNSISRKMVLRGFEDGSGVLDNLALLLENGVPNLIAVRIYQAGIRSRVAATEISPLFMWQDLLSIRDYRRELMAEKEFYKSKVGPTAAEWIELLSSLHNRPVQTINRIADFELPVNPMPEIRELFCRRVQGRIYLMNERYNFNIEMMTDGLRDIADVAGVFFKRVGRYNRWTIEIYNPNIVVVNPED